VALAKARTAAIHPHPQREPTWGEAHQEEEKPEEMPTILQRRRKEVRPSIARQATPARPNRQSAEWGALAPEKTRQKRIERWEREYAATEPVHQQREQQQQPRLSSRPPQQYSDGVRSANPGQEGQQGTQHWTEASTLHALLFRP